MRRVLKVRRKGLIILPKSLREKAGIREGEEVLAEVVDDTIVLRSLKPRVVNIDPSVVEKIIMEERREWEDRIDRITREAGS